MKGIEKKSLQKSKNGIFAIEKNAAHDPGILQDMHEISTKTM